MSKLLLQELSCARVLSGVRENMGEAARGAQLIRERGYIQAEDGQREAAVGGLLRRHRRGAFSVELLWSGDHWVRTSLLSLYSSDVLII